MPIELTTTVEEPGLAPHSSQWLFLASDNSIFLNLFLILLIYHNTLILRHTHLAVGNHPEIEKEKKDVCNCTRRRSNRQCYDWKSTAQTTAPYRHTHTHTHAHTQADTCMDTHASTHISSFFHFYLPLSGFMIPLVQIMIVHHRTHASTHTHTQAHVRTHTHAQTHSYTHIGLVNTAELHMTSVRT